MRRLATALAPPSAAAAAAVVKVNLWKSPIPYLFGGLGLTMALIAGALIVLACSYRERPPADSPDGGEKEAAAVAVELQLSVEPKILVIMAGDDTPSYIATPAAATTNAADGALCCGCSGADQEDDRSSSC